MGCGDDQHPCAIIDDFSTRMIWIRHGLMLPLPQTPDAARL